MSLEKLYQEQILAFARKARESSVLEDAALTATVKNPVCGDRVRIDLDINDDGSISRIGAAADGCALCEASTGLLLTCAPGLHADDLKTMDHKIEAWLKGDETSQVLDGQDAFTPVKEFAARHGCVSLPFVSAAEALSSHSAD